jgi:hypothetical protein
MNRCRSSSLQVPTAVRGYRWRQVQACFSLAWKCETGRGVRVDPARALDLYELACGRDDVQGCLSGGSLFERVPELTADPQRQVALFKRACTLGDVNGCEQWKLATASTAASPGARPGHRSAPCECTSWSRCSSSRATGRSSPIARNHTGPGPRATPTDTPCRRRSRYVTYAVNASYRLLASERSAARSMGVHPRDPMLDYSRLGRQVRVG